MPRIEYPECGRVINTHGCRGGVKIEPWCDTPEALAALPAVYVREGESLRRLAIRRASVFRHFVVAELAGVESMEAAEALRGTVLYARREELHLPEGALLVAELVGLPVYHAETGEPIGKLREVIHPGATDIYVIDTARGEAMVPAVPAFIRSVSLGEGICISPIEGMLP